MKPSYSDPPGRKMPTEKDEREISQLFGVHGLPETKRSNHEAPLSYFEEDGLRIVSKLYAKDFNKFGYEMGAEHQDQDYGRNVIDWDSFSFLHAPLIHNLVRRAAAGAV